jgi:hypothetical protein
MAKKKQMNQQLTKEQGKKDNAHYVYRYHPFLFELSVFLNSSMGLPMRYSILLQWPYGL